MAKIVKKQKKTAEEKELCRTVTPTFRVSYPHVFKPNRVKDGDKPKYSITMMFPKDTDLSGLKEVMKQAKIAEFGDKKNWPDDLVSPVVDGDNAKFADKEGYAGHWIIKASSNEDQQPSVVDRSTDPILTPTDFYPGCHARAAVYAYVWEYLGKQGVGFILDHVQKMKDDKPFGGKKSATSVFSPISSDEDTDGDDAEDFR